MWPTGQPPSDCVELELLTRRSRLNSVSVPVGTDGKVSILNSTGEVHVTADVAGCYSP